jgi:hypothetical protein
VAPPFTSGEKDVIAAWSETMRRHGVGAKFSTEHGFLEEALHVCVDHDAGSWWLVHKTPHGAVAVRLWPGLATIALTIADALGIIARAVVGQRAWR